MNIVSLDSQRPHLTLDTGNAVHVMPVALVADVAEGRKPPSILGDDCLRVIVDEWLTEQGWGRG